MFKDIDSADVILVSEDQIPFQAHRYVLSASSQVLKDLLLDNFSPNLLMKQEFRSILQFMYLGEITFIENHISQVLNNTNELQMKHWLMLLWNTIEGDGITQEDSKNVSF